MKLLCVRAFSRMASACKCSSDSITKSSFLVLAWILMIRLSYSFPTNALTRLSPEYSYSVTRVYFCVFYIVYPIVGLLADVKFGKLKVALSSAFFVVVISSLLLLLSYLVIQHEMHLSRTFVTVIDDFISIGTILNLSGVICFELSITSLALDQLVNSSTTVLRAFLWWHSWVHMVDLLYHSVSTCVLNHSVYHAVIVPIVIHIVSVVLVVITCCCCRNVFRSDLPTVNPLKLIARVLNYARKNRSPRNRSALTYWIDDYPPRIDLGKSKYGGPFTEEEVENVKTFFRLLPVPFVILMIFLLSGYGQFHTSINTTHQHPEECLVTSYSVHYSAIVVFIPFKVLVLDRYCHKMRCFSTLFRVIGFGIFLTIVGIAMLPVFDYFAVSTNSTSTCLYNNNPDNSTYTIEDFRVNYHFLIIPQVFTGLGSFAIPASFEFLVAQAPLEMRGVIVGMFYSVAGLYQQISSLLILPFQTHSLWPSCEFYIYILHVALMVVSLVGVIIIGKWYKLRRRDDPFNAYAVVENFYERDFERRDNYGSVEDDPVIN